MNKPTKNTVSDLKSALQSLEWLLNQPHHPEQRATILQTGDAVRRALTQLTQDDRIACPSVGCRVTKPTKRAMAAHVAFTHGGMRS